MVIGQNRPRGIVAEFADNMKTPLRIRRSESIMRPAVEPRESQHVSNDPRRATIGWWGLSSVVSGLLAGSFAPASMMGGASWAAQINLFWPIWAAICIIGMMAGIRGLQKQRRATRNQRLLAFAGCLLCLFVFIALTIIALVALQ